MCTCVSVVARVARKLRLCPSYSRRGDRINLVRWRSLYQGGGYIICQIQPQVKGEPCQLTPTCTTLFVL